MARLSELVGILTSIRDTLNATGVQLEKSLTEIKAAVVNLELPPEVMTKLDELNNIAGLLKKSAQQLDDLNPDV